MIHMVVSRRGQLDFLLLLLASTVPRGALPTVGAKVPNPAKLLTCTSKWVSKGEKLTLTATVSMKLLSVALFAVQGPD
jgi:hypothetical protein